MIVVMRRGFLVVNDVVAMSSAKGGGPIRNVEGEWDSSSCQSLNQGLAVRRLEQI